MPSDNLMLTGPQIKDLRNRFGLSQQQFGARLGVTHAHISKIENGKETPSETLLRLIRYEFGVDRFVGLPPAETSKKAIKEYLNILDKMLLQEELTDGCLFHSDFLLAAYITILRETTGSNMYQELLLTSIGTILDEISLFLSESNNLKEDAQILLKSRMQRLQLEVNDSCQIIFDLLKERMNE